jgi:hypothetical protein
MFFLQEGKEPNPNYGHWHSSSGLFLDDGFTWDIVEAWPKHQTAIGNRAIVGCYLFGD